MMGELIDCVCCRCKSEPEVVGTRGCPTRGGERAARRGARRCVCSALRRLKTALEQLQGQYDRAEVRTRTGLKRQLFGQKSEKRLDLDDEVQLNLLAGLGVDKPPSRDEVPSETVSYERRAKVRDAAVTHSGLRFRSRGAGEDHRGEGPGD